MDRCVARLVGWYYQAPSSGWGHGELLQLAGEPGGVMAIPNPSDIMALWVSGFTILTR